MAWTEKYVSVAGAGAHDGTSEANAWTLAEALAAYAAGQRLNVKAGTYTNTTTNRTFGTAGTTTAPIWWRGYNTTIGDIDTDNTLTKPVISFTTGRFFVTAGYQDFSNLDINGASTVAQVDISGTHLTFHRCRIECTGAGGMAVDTGSGADGPFEFTACWIKAASSADVIRVRNSCSLMCCAIEGGANGAVLATNSGAVLNLDFCTFKDQGGDAVRVTVGAGLFATNCSVYSPASDGIEFTAEPAYCKVVGCIFSECGGYGINNSTGTATARVRRSHNLFYSNTSGKENGLGDTPSRSEQTDSASPFTDAASNDLSLVSGSNAKANGPPGKFENETYTSYLDIGAVQRQEGAGGSAGARLVGPSALVTPGGCAA